jgi:hypothetical protein
VPVMVKIGGGRSIELEISFELGQKAPHPLLTYLAITEVRDDLVECDRERVVDPELKCGDEDGAGGDSTAQ